MDMGVVELTADAEATLHTSVGDFMRAFATRPHSS